LQKEFDNLCRKWTGRKVARKNVVLSPPLSGLSETRPAVNHNTIEYRAIARDDRNWILSRGAAKITPVGSASAVVLTDQIQQINV
jgi:hypothetical protein